MLVNQQVSFGYCPQLKNVVSLDAYTGKTLHREERTLEHIKPHSKKGRDINNIGNLLITERDINGQRKNTRFDKWLNDRPEIVKNIQDYLNKLRGLKVDGIDYVEELKKTLNTEARGVVTFQGNK